MEKNLFIKMPKIENNNDREKPEHGCYSECFIEVNSEKYLIKKPNRNTYPNNEIYLTSIVEILVGEKNSVHCKFSSEEEIDLTKITTELEAKLKIASLWIEGAKNLMEAKINLSQKPKNLICALFSSLLINNIDPNPGNILSDGENVFYLIDPLIMSMNNRHKINTENFYSSIDSLYQEFLNNLSKNNIKNKVSFLLNEYFKLYNQYFFLSIKQSIYKNGTIDKTQEEVRMFERNLERITQKNKDTINTNLIPHLINLMSVEEIVEEISIIRNCDKKKLREIGNYFESTEIFNNFGQKGIPINYMNMILGRLSELEKINLSSDI